MWHAGKRVTAVHFEDAVVKIMRTWVLMRLSSHLFYTHTHTNSFTHLIAAAAGACWAHSLLQRLLSNAKAMFGVQCSLTFMPHTLTLSLNRSNISIPFPSHIVMHINSKMKERKYSKKNHWKRYRKREENGKAEYSQEISGWDEYK